MEDIIMKHFISWPPQDRNVGVVAAFDLHSKGVRCKGVENNPVF